MSEVVIFTKDILVAEYPPMSKGSQPHSKLPIQKHQCQKENSHNIWLGIPPVQVR